MLDDLPRNAQLSRSTAICRCFLASAALFAVQACSADDARGSQTGLLGPDGGTGLAADGAANIQGDAASSSDAAVIMFTDAGMLTTDPTACAKAELATKRVIPRVWLLVDGSGSMGAALNGLAGTSRWSVLRDALMTAGTGLVSRLDNAVAFGLMVYDGGLSPPGIPNPLCPRVITVDPAVGNFAAINTAYPATQTGASTPTHYALLTLSERIAAAGPSPDGPTFVVLATDGKPNLCDFHDGIPATDATDQEAVMTVAQLAGNGTKVFAISLAGGDADVESHLQAVATAGGTGQPVFTPTSQDALATALTTIVGGAASCDVRVEGSVVAGRECTGDVKLNGMPLVCNDPNGYRLKEDRQTLSLLGTACVTLQTTASASLTAAFPCEDVILR